MGSGCKNKQSSQLKDNKEIFLRKYSTNFLDKFCLQYYKYVTFYRVRKFRDTFSLQYIV
jgi:hypothetical protein